MKVFKVFLLSFFSICITARAAVNVETVDLFGPEIFKADQSKPQPKSETKTFTVQGSVGNTKIDIVNGANLAGLIQSCDLRDGLGELVRCLAGNLKAALILRKRPTYMEVSLNGVKIVDKKPGLLDFSYTKSVALKPNNTLVVLVKGSKDAFITIRVRGEKTNHPPVPAVQIVQASNVAPSRVMLDASQSTDPDGQNLTYSWNLGDGTIASGAIANHEFLQPGTYNVVLTVTDSLGLSQSKNAQVRVMSPTVPADPTPAATLIEPAVNSSMAEQMKFIYEGPSAVQFGVQPGVIDESRAGHLHGKVVDELGHGLAGVRVELLGEDEIGYTFTRADGAFDLVANGGGTPTLTFERSGYFKAQRALELTGNISLTIPNVVLIRPDEKVTTVAMNSNVVQVARGSTVEDNRGSRTTTVLIPSGTDAQIVLPSGGTRSMSSLNIRATEYTVGSEGPSRMPASLPAQSAYTYAVELSADEALAAGASSVKFSKPLSFYVDNFLNMPTGTVVPLGVYNSKTASWEAEKDGYVFKILSVQNGQAVVDLYGDGNPVTSGELNQLGFDSAELTQLAQLYGPGKTFWRFQIGHFSTLDGNFGVANNTIAKDGMGPKTPTPPKNKCQVAVGCEIDYTRRTFSERIPLPAMPFELTYSTDRQVGYLGGSTYEIPLSNDVVDPYLIRFEVTTEVAGRTFSETIASAPNVRYKFSLWDGKDAFGRQLTSQTKARVTVKYVAYKVYQICHVRTVNINGRSFAVSRYNCSIQQSDDPPNITEYPFEISIGPTLAAANQGIGGWDLSIHHFFDRTAKRVYLGDGMVYAASSLPYRVSTFAGTGVAGASGDDGPAKDAMLSSGRGLAVDDEGSIYVVDGCCKIRKVTRDGMITRFAGTGVEGFGGNGGPALNATFGRIGRPSFKRDGTMVFTDAVNHVIWSIEKDGIARVIAGTPQVSGNSGDGGLAKDALLNAPAGVVAGNDGSLYFADSGNNVLRKIEPGGFIMRIAGTGEAGAGGDGGSALEAKFNNPAFCIQTHDGSLLVADRANHAVRKISPNGTITTIAGTLGEAGFAGDGGAATAAKLNSPQDLDIDRQGNVYITDNNNNRIRRVSGGYISTIVGGGSNATPTSFSSGLQIRLRSPSNVIWNPIDNSILFSEGAGAIVRKYALALEPAPMITAINSPDGKYIYNFDERGRHLSTESLLTHATLYTFHYDSRSRLDKITDGYNASYVIVRDGQGRPTSLTGPDGHVIRFELTGENLSAVAGPEGERTEISYGSGNLISQFKSATGHTTSYEYDELGLLKRDNNPGGGFLDFVLNGDFTEFTNSLGHKTKYRQYANLSYGGYNDETTAPDGTVTLRTQLEQYPESFVIYPEGHGIQSVTNFDPLAGTSEYAVLNRYDGFPGAQFQSDSENRTLTPTSGDNFEYTKVKRGATRVESLKYDSASRTYQSRTDLGQVATMQIDQFEKPTSIQIGSFLPTSLSYDSRGRLYQVNQGERQTTIQYNAAGDVQSVTDAMGHATQFQSDGSRRVTKMELPDSRTLQTTYTPGGQVATLTTPLQVVHTLLYNAFDFLTTYAGPIVSGSSGAISYQFNSERQIVAETHANGESKTFGYDSFGRVNSIGTSSNYLGYNYDVAGRVSRMTSSDNVAIDKTFVGPTAVRRVYSGIVNGTVGAQYFDRNRIKAQVFNGQAINFDYDADERLSLAGDLAINREQMSGLIDGLSVGDYSQQLIYNPYGEVERSNFSLSGNGFFSQALTRDKLGRVSSKVEIVQGVTTAWDYFYDLGGRLTGVRRNGAGFASYTYGPNGNRVSAIVGGQTIPATYDAQDRLLTYGSNSYTYDAHGNLLSRTNSATGLTTQFTYDVFGQLKKAVSSDGQTVEYATDGENRRVQVKVNGDVVRSFFYNDEGQLIAFVDASGSRAQFIYASQRHSPDYMTYGNARFYFVKDLNGSIRRVINVDTHALAERLDYDEFGRVLFDANPGFQPFGFAGGIYDPDTKLVRFGARDYDPETGRWTSKDPILLSGGDINLYGYSLNDPINRVDPDGRASIIAPAIVIGGIIAGLVGNAIIDYLYPPPPPGSSPDNPLPLPAPNQCPIPGRVPTGAPVAPPYWLPGTNPNPPPQDGVFPTNRTPPIQIPIRMPYSDGWPT